MYQEIYNRNIQMPRLYIHRKEVTQWVEDVYQWMFLTDKKLYEPAFFKVEAMRLEAQLHDILKKLSEATHEVCCSSERVFQEIEIVHAMLFSDLEAIFEFDPAAKSKEEIVLSYPGFFAISIYRIAHILWQLNVPVIPRIISEHVHGKTGIDIHPGATIGSRFFIDHGTGIVIGETAVIGNNVKLYQGVTLGALTVKKTEAEIKRHPTLQDNVTVYANATILGGTTVIGHHSLVGGNAFITGSVVPYSLVYTKNEVVIKDNGSFPEPINFII